MNSAYMKMIGLLAEARNPKKRLTTDHAGRILRRLGKMSASPNLSTQSKAAAAQDQLAMHIRQRLVEPHEAHTAMDTIKGIWYQDEIAKPNLHKGAKTERSRQSREN